LSIPFPFDCPVERGAQGEPIFTQQVKASPTVPAELFKI